jgi:hypothetical protein
MVRDRQAIETQFFRAPREANQVFGFYLRAGGWQMQTKLHYKSPSIGLLKNRRSSSEGLKTNGGRLKSLTIFRSGWDLSKHEFLFSVAY